MVKLLSAAALAALLAAPGLAAAAEPVQLTDKQMDQVAAGRDQIFVLNAAAVNGDDDIGVAVSTAINQALSQAFAFGDLF